MAAPTPGHPLHLEFARVAIHVAGLGAHYLDQTEALRTADALARALGGGEALPPAEALPNFVPMLGSSTLFTLPRAHDRCERGWCDARLVAGDVFDYQPGGGYPGTAWCQGIGGGYEVYAAFVQVNGAIVAGGVLPREWLEQWQLPAETSVVVADRCPSRGTASASGGAPRAPWNSGWAAPSGSPVTLSRVASEATALLRRALKR